MFTLSKPRRCTTVLRAVQAALRRWYESFVRRDLRTDPEKVRLANRVTAFSMAMFVWVVVFSGVYWVLAAPASAGIVLSGGVLLVLILFLLRQGRSPRLCAQILCGAAVYVYAVLGILNGGLSAPSTMWYASVPVLSMLLLGGRTGVYWTMLSVGIILSFALAEQLGFPFAHEVGPQGAKFLALSGLVCLVICVSMLVYVLKTIEQHANSMLYEANRSLQLQAATDGLTGILNRRGFDQVLQDEWQRHQLAAAPLTLVLIDVDLFKQYNDEFGHLAGDDCLRAISSVIQECVRRTEDYAARFGGEEFAIVMPNVNAEMGEAMANHIRKRIKALSIPNPRSWIDQAVTISVGAATMVPSDADTHVDLLREADRALYKAKETGRDRVIHSAPVEIAILEAIAEFYPH
jgi:diguanylate cyclase (GGDEF)-like protein